ncbi:MAG: phosphate/phosphite/phosphonate ABC transporter substrate-binding protein [Minwuia sp.]|uniref:phosphate/phosphite/phosphonate ABC transporter substrate-binding protein n=1 Tax=Minwuia sp. TaxID=2493630 RepID=UPI003A8999FE
MIAALPMYDWPVLQPVNDRLWSAVAALLRAEGIDAPERLTREDRYAPLWERKDLLFAQTCGLPFNTRLKGRVRYVATPWHEVEGCGEGTYSSAIVVHRDRAGLDPERLGAMRLSINGPDSWSGCVALDRWFRARGEAMPEPAMVSGGHLFSMQAVAEGEADGAAIDSIALGLAQRHLPDLTDRLHVVDWTETRWPCRSSRGAMPPTVWCRHLPTRSQPPSPAMPRSVMLSG